MDNCRVKGQPVPSSLIHEMVDSASLLDSPTALRARLAEDGYLYLKGVVDKDAIMAARQEVFERLVKVGEIREPAIDGIATGDSRRKELEPDLGAFWRSISEGRKLRAASNGRDMQRIMSLIFGEPARNQDYIFLRAGALGRATGLHFDYPFFTRAHDKVNTVWMPIGDVPVEDGPVVVVEEIGRAHV